MTARSGRVKLLPTQSRRVILSSSGLISSTVTVSGGVATFSSLSISNAGNGYTLKASSGTLTAATSAAFNVAARNHDDHVKNSAFLMNRSGEWSIAPAYDITYSFDRTGRYTRVHQLSLNGKRENFDDERDVEPPVADHERSVVRSGHMQPLQGPEGSAHHHQHTDQCTDDPEHDVEQAPHEILPV